MGGQAARRARRGPSARQIKRRRRTALLVILAALAVIVYAALDSAFLESVDTRGATVEQLSLDSDAIGRQLDVDVVVPPNAGEVAQMPLLVFLHGRGGSAHSFTGNEAMFAALHRLGNAAPIIAFPDGGDHGYWHDRDEGEWGAYVVEEVIPEVTRRFPVDRARVAIGGISMGGFGAYDLALLHPGRFCAVGGHSPALWLSGGDTAPGAFDDAEDFERHDVIATVQNDPNAFADIPIWNDAGEGDPFLSADVAFSSALRASGADLTNRIWPGGHEQSYWDLHWTDYLRFYARALRHCG